MRILGRQLGNRWRLTQLVSGKKLFPANFFDKSSAVRVGAMRQAQTIERDLQRAAIHTRFAVSSTHRGHGPRLIALSDTINSTSRGKKQSLVIISECHCTLQASVNPTGAVTDGCIMVIELLKPVYLIQNATP